MKSDHIRALFIGAHNDECEYGAGGLAWLLHQAGVHTMFYNTAASPEQCSLEAAAMLGAEKVAEDSLTRVWINSEEHVNRILQVILEFKPDILFLHYPQDTHVEHRETAKASYAAVCMAPANGWQCREIYAFEAGPDQTVQYFKPDFVVDISDIMGLLAQVYHHFGQELGDQLLQEKTVSAAFRGLKQNYLYGEAYKIIKFPDRGDDLLLRTILGERFSWFGNAYYPAYGDLFFR